MPAVVPWLAAFLVLTIVGERLELSRVVRPPGSGRQAFILAVAVLACGVVLSVVDTDAGTRATWLAFGLPRGGPGYDASLHALFLGFVMAMVFGHAPVILPAVLALPLPYRPRFYAHLALLHAGLVIRVGGGDVLGLGSAWQLGGLLDVIALLLFVVSSALATAEGLRGRTPAPRTPRA